MKKTNTKKQKLNLDVQKVRSLSPEQLEQANGGAWSGGDIGTGTCAPTPRCATC